MGKRGPKPKRIVSEEWTPNLAYAIGLLATDGYLAKKYFLIDLTSKDKEQLRNFCSCLEIQLRIGEKKSGFGSHTQYRVQLKNFYFYNFLLSIGLTPAKSKTLASLRIPDEYFFDFLRGVFDGDGSIHSYWDKRWKSSYMYYVTFSSASREFLSWIQTSLQRLLNVQGHTTHAQGHTTYQLKYAKREGREVLGHLYYAPAVVCLSRKRLKIKQILATVGEKL